MGGVTLGMSVLPSDESAIRVAVGFFLGLWICLGVFSALVAVTYATDPAYDYMYYFVWTCFAVQILGLCSWLAESVHRNWTTALRVMLLDAWMVGRWMCVSSGAILLFGFALPLAWRDPLSAMSDPYMPGTLATCLSFIVVPLPFTSAVRDAVRNFLAVSLSSCTRGGSSMRPFEYAHYALTAALMKVHDSGATPETALANATARFFCCTFDCTLAPLGEERHSNAARLAALRTTLCPAEFGNVDAFVSGHPDACASRTHAHHARMRITHACASRTHDHARHAPPPPPLSSPL